MRSIPTAVGVSLLSLVAACGDSTPADEPDAASPPLVDGATPDATVLPSCPPPPACPPSTADHLNMCGRLLDAATNAPLSDDPAAAAPCDLAAPTATGVCSLTVRFYHPLRFADHPATEPALVPASLAIDGCGYYRALDIPRFGFPYMLVTVDDASGVADHRVLTASLTPEDATVVRDLPSLSRETDAAWSRQAGLTGQTLGERGALMLTFRTRAGLRAGVTPTSGGQELASGWVSFFADADGRRTTVAPSATRTGADGTALIQFGRTAFYGYAGTGGLPQGCGWPDATQPTITGVFTVADVFAGGSTCP